MLNNTLGQCFGNLRELGREEAPLLYDFVEKAKKTLGIAEPITLVHSDAGDANLYALMGKTTKGTYKNNIIITEGALGLFNGKNLRTHFPDDLKAVVAHEMSHIKDGYFLSGTMQRLPLFALPLAFAAGYYVLDKAWHKKNEDENLSLPAAIKKVVIHEKMGLAKAPDDSGEKDAVMKKAELYDYWLRLGGTVASAAVGLVAGAGVIRHLGLAREFRADRVGGLLVHPDAMASAVKKLMNQMERNRPGKICFRTELITTSPDIDTALNKLWQRLKSYYQQEKNVHYNLEIFDPHPTLNQRITALEQLKNSPDFRTRLEASPPAPGGITT